MMLRTGRFTLDFVHKNKYKTATDGHPLADAHTAWALHLYGLLKVRNII